MALLLAPRWIQCAKTEERDLLQSILDIKRTKSERYAMVASPKKYDELRRSDSNTFGSSAEALPVRPDSEKI